MEKHFSFSNTDGDKGRHGEEEDCKRTFRTEEIDCKKAPHFEEEDFCR